MTLSANVAAILSDLGGGLDPVHADSPKSECRMLLEESVNEKDVIAALFDSRHRERVFLSARSK